MDAIAYWIKRYIYLIPPIQLLATLVISFLPVSNSDFVGLGNSLGYSIVTGVVYVTLFCLKDKYCLFTKVAAASLFLIAMLNFIAWCIVSIDQYAFYEIVIQKTVTGIAILLFFILLLIKKNPK